ncbi:MAG: adenylosuccinate synthase [Selenomonadaceae bacterium]|nr:adenylosuccinate synthase [Selenomonadaceae bacterium]
MSTVIISGTQWGDEGKGKIVDYLASQANVVVRFQGGSNAGHTVTVNGEEYKLRLIPSGILCKDTLCVIANGVVFDPQVFLEEVETIKSRGIDTSNIRISNRAHVVMPWHKIFDELNEELRGDKKIGTTKRGIGPCYIDKADRIGIRVCDLIDPEEFAARCREVLTQKNFILRKVFNHAPISYEKVLNEYEIYAEKIAPYVCDTITLLNEEIDAGKKVLFEGAQATMLDIDYGTYPYVTASHPISSGVGVGTGVAPKKIDKVFGVVKAYCTRVGEGPFPTEQLNEIGDKLRTAGHEFGTVTGRPRRTGWLDACVVKYAGQLSGIDYMAVTRLDILDDFDEIKMCVAYEVDGKILNEIPASLKVLARVNPIYETFEGWKSDISQVKTYDELPDNAKKYLERMAEVTKIDLGIISVGPNRDQTIVVAENIFE